MKRLCLIIACLFLFTQTALALPLLVGQKVVYRGTVTGLRISSVAGTAFIDNAGATIPTLADGNHIIEIYDSSNRMLKGVLKAAGSSEGLASNIITDPTFDDASKWNCSANLSVSGGVCVGTTAAKDEYAIGASGSIVALGLYKLYADVVVTAGTVALRVFSSNGDTITTTGTYSTYKTQGGGANAQLRVLSTYSGTVDNMYLKQVTSPSSSGATIVSAKGGTTYNFVYKNASFTYNAANYYVIIKEAK